MMAPPPPLRSDDDEEEDEDDDDDDLYDNHGRLKGGYITRDYRERMMELEKKLGVKSYFTASTHSDDENELRDMQEGIGRITVAGKPTEQSAAAVKPLAVKQSKEAEKIGPEKKGVRFAGELDIASEAPLAVIGNGKAAEPLVEPLSDVIERSGTTKPTVEKKEKKVSKFKKDRGGAAEAHEASKVGIKGPHDAPVRFLDQERRIAPAGPEGQTIAAAILERPTPVDTRAPDDLDADLLHKETAAEYHKRRNRLIQKEGGFTRKEEEAAITAADEAEEEAWPRMSRFKAARLARS